MGGADSGDESPLASEPSCLRRKAKVHDVSCRDGRVLGRTGRTHPLGTNGPIGRRLGW